MSGPEQLFAFDRSGNQRVLIPSYAKVPPRGAKGKIGLDPSNASLVIKRFLPSMDAAELVDAKSRIEAMLTFKGLQTYYKDGAADVPKFAWPIEALYGEPQRRRLLGFTMPRLHSDRAASLAKFWVPRERAALRINETYEFRIAVGSYLAARLQELHAQAIFAVDFNDTNIWLSKLNGAVSLIDCDGFSIPASQGRFPASAVAPGIRCPEGRGRPISELGKSQDLFALGIHIFRLLNRDIHPFDCDSDAPGLTSRQEKLDAGHYAYAIQPDRRFRPVHDSLHVLLPLPHRLLFDRCFNGPATNRPEASDWLAALATSTNGTTSNAAAEALAKFARGVDRGTISLPVAPQISQTVAPLFPYPSGVTAFTPASPAPTSVPAPATASSSPSSPSSTAKYWVWVLGAIFLLYLISRIVSSPNGSPNQATPPATSAQPIQAPVADSSPSMVSPATFTTSFNCGAASAWVETQICTNSALADSDRRQADLYSTAMARAGDVDKDRLRQSQRAWLKARSSCGDVPCIEHAYSDRIAFLEGWMPTPDQVTANTSDRAAPQSPQPRIENTLPAGTITCILPYGQETQASKSECERLGGSVYN